MRNGLIGLLAVMGLAFAPAAHAASRVVNIDKAQATVPLGAIAQGGEVLVRGLAVAGKNVVNTVAFQPGANRIRVNTSWVVGEPDAPFRLVGVNVDLLDNGGIIVVSDTFQGIVAGTATSTLVAENLVPGTRYGIRLSGTAVGRGSFTMAIRPGVPTPPT